MRSQDEVRRYRLRAVAALVGGVLFLCAAPVALAGRPVTSQAGFDAFLDAWASDEEATSPAPSKEQQTTARPETEPVTQTKGTAPATPVGSSQAAPAGASSASLLTRAAPVLLGLLGVAIVLLGLAALPPARRRASALSVLVAERRVEIGLVGGAALASAAIGLVVAAAAG